MNQPILATEPHSEESEKAILGCILNGATEAIPELELKDFYDPMYRLLFSHIQNIYKEHATMDMLLLNESTKNDEEFIARGGSEFTLSLALANPTPSLWHSALLILKQKRRAREALAAVRRIQNVANDEKTTENVSEVMEEEGRRVAKFDVKKHVSPSTLSWEQSVRGAVTTIANTAPDSMCTYPIPALNNILGGIGRGEVVTVAGQSGEGKSDFLRLVAEHNAERGRCVHMYQFEMDAEENTRRFLLRKLNAARAERKEAPITAIDLFFNKITPWDQAELQKIQEEEAKKTFPLHTYGGTSLTVEGFIQEINKSLNGSPPKLVVLDHIHYFSGDDGESESESLGRAMRMLRQWTKETNIPILLAAHMRKPAKASVEQTTHDIYGSSNIAKESTTVIILKRGSGQTTFSVWKSRVGGDYRRFEVAYDTVTKLWTGEAKNDRSVWDAPMKLDDAVDYRKDLPF